MIAPRHLSRVLLPEPDGPTRPTTSPGLTCMFTCFRASTAVSPLPYTLRRPSIRMPPLRDGMTMLAFVLIRSPPLGQP